MARMKKRVELCGGRKRGVLSTTDSSAVCCATWNMLGPGCWNILCDCDGNRESRYCTEDSPHRNLAMPMPMPMRPHNVFFARSSKESALAKSIGVSDSKIRNDRRDLWGVS